MKFSTLLAPLALVRLVEVDGLRFGDFDEEEALFFDEEEALQNESSLIEVDGPKGVPEKAEEADDKDPPPPSRRRRNDGVGQECGDCFQNYQKLEKCRRQNMKKCPRNKPFRNYAKKVCFSTLAGCSNSGGGGGGSLKGVSSKSDLDNKGMQELKDMAKDAGVDPGGSRAEITDRLLAEAKKGFEEESGGVCKIKDDLETKNEKELRDQINYKKLANTRGMNKDTMVSVLFKKTLEEKNADDLREMLTEETGQKPDSKRGQQRKNEEKV